MRVNFKFKPGSAAAGRAGVLAALRRAGAADVRPLFPGEKDRDLAGLYVVESGRAKDRDRVLELLNKMREVEFAEPEPARKLVKPARGA